MNNHFTHYPLPNAIKTFAVVFIVFFENFQNLLLGTR